VFQPEGVFVATGCFSGTLDAFHEAVQRKHGDSEYGREYEAVIALIETLAEMRGKRS
jgi:hypothetical protein